MRLSELFEAWMPRLKQTWPQQIVYRETRRLVAALLKQSEIWVEAHQEDVLSSKQVTLLQKALRAFAQGQPIAQITHAAPFFGRTFFVNKHVLIPREETTLLINEALTHLDRQTLVVEIGTGSGCIAVTLAAERPLTTVFASEISPAALIVAKKNARELLPKKSLLSFFKGSLLHTTLQKKVRTHIASNLLFLANLPYLPLKDRAVMSVSVTKFEPSQALFAAQNGRALIEKLLKQIQSFSKKDGRPFTALFEFDPPQANALRTFAESLFPNATIEIKKDECGRSRLLSIYCPNPANV